MNESANKSIQRYDTAAVNAKRQKQPHDPT
jgi:hypothetical protein